MNRILLKFALVSSLATTAPAIGGELTGKIVFIASNSVLPQDLIESFFIGYEGAIQSFSSNKNNPKVEFAKKLDFSGDKMISKTLVSEAIKQGALAIVGIPSTHEAILSAPECVKGKILCLSAGASFTGDGKYSKFLFSIMPTLKENANSVAELLSFQKPKSNGLIVRNPAAVYSLEFVKYLQSSMGKDSSQAEVIDLDSALNVKKEDFLKIAKAAYVVFSAFPFESTKSLETFTKQNPNLALYANGSWDAKSFLWLRKQLANDGLSITMPVVWLPKSKEAADFEKQAAKFLQVDPTTEVAAGYDAGLVMAKILSTAKVISRDGLLESASAGICVEGSSVGRFCLPKEGGNANRKRIWGKLVAKGFGFVPWSELSGEKSSK